MRLIRAGDGMNLKGFQAIYWKCTRYWYHIISGIRLKKTVKLRMGGSIKGGTNIELGEGVFLGKFFMLASYRGGQIYIGDRVCGQENIRISAVESVQIESDCLLASHILITDNNHGMNPVVTRSYAEQVPESQLVHIGKGCWIGEQCIILSGTDIGEKSIIGANSVVCGKIPAYSVACGSPARVIKTWDFNENRWKKIT